MKLFNTFSSLRLRSFSLAFSLSSVMYFSKISLKKLSSSLNLHRSINNITLYKQETLENQLVHRDYSNVEEPDMTVTLAIRSVTEYGNLPKSKHGGTSL